MGERRGRPDKYKLVKDDLLLAMKKIPMEYDLPYSTWNQYSCSLYCEKYLNSIIKPPTFKGKDILVGHDKNLAYYKALIKKYENELGYFIIYATDIYLGARRPSESEPCKSHTIQYYYHALLFEFKPCYSIPAFRTRKRKLKHEEIAEHLIDFACCEYILEQTKILFIVDDSKQNRDMILALYKNKHNVTDNTDPTVSMLQASRTCGHNKIDQFNSLDVRFLAIPHALYTRKNFRLPQLKEKMENILCSNKIKDRNLDSEEDIISSVQKFFREHAEIRQFNCRGKWILRKCMESEMDAVAKNGSNLYYPWDIEDWEYGNPPPNNAPPGMLWEWMKAEIHKCDSKEPDTQEVHNHEEETLYLTFNQRELRTVSANLGELIDSLAMSILG